MYEPLDAARIRMHLSAVGATLCRDIAIHSEIDSTNTWLVSRLRTGQAEGGDVCLAERQTAGRGRRGRTWISPDNGGLYLSLVWQEVQSSYGVGPVTLAIGLAVLEAIQNVSGIKPGIKWPNDIYVDGRKLAGILVERIATQGNGFLVVGIGVNLATPGLEERASVAPVGLDEFWPEAGSKRNLLAAGIVDSVLQFVMQYEKTGFAHIRSRWEACDITRGKVLDVYAADGRQLRCMGDGVDDDGRLRVLCDGLVTHLEAAEVTLRMV